PAQARQQKQAPLPGRKTPRSLLQVFFSSATSRLIFCCINHNAPICEANFAGIPPEKQLSTVKQARRYSRQE
ncbi:MAG: hypothetical protein K5770_08965, partial [Lachnospiraceae bacterium]|nr:hypothetical protein [Lachnospiraceae bacterium]